MRALWWRFVAISALFAALLSLGYVALVREVTGPTRAAIQRSLFLAIARIVEDGPPAQAMQRLDRVLAESPEITAEVWLVTPDDQVLASRGGQPLPQRWFTLAKPQAVHEVMIVANPVWATPQIMLTRLAGEAPVYLVGRHFAQPARPLVVAQSVIFVLTLGAAIFLGLSLVTLYLRGRSREARRVIARLESGDLAARFQVDRFDALGKLLLDFNRMADEIERLIHRLQATEDARRHLLRELSHDLRTPLTSLRTAADALAAHGEAMPAAERGEFIAIIGGELDYFRRLIDDLFFIAELAEPRYRKQLAAVDLADALAAELRAIEGAHAARGLRFTLQREGDAAVAGDALLIARLLRNALDNAAKHAAARVSARVAGAADRVEIEIDDDGPGLSAADIAAFGQRRSQRLAAGASSALSLGLGSVIMKTIVELHGGRLALLSRAAGDAVPGTRLHITLPR